MLRAGVAAVACVCAGCSAPSTTVDASSMVDDGSLDDGSIDAEVITPANIIFVTSTTYVPGALGGLAGADAACQARASAAGLPGTFVAWLSSATVDARDRLGSARGWRRPDGKPFANAQGDLISGRILYPPMIDELGARVTDPVAYAVTNTTADGLGSVNDCGGFASTTGMVSVGLPAGTTRIWTEGRYFSLTLSCATPMRLFCMSTDLNVPVLPSKTTGPRAFLSMDEFWSANGIASADAACNSTAAQYGISGVFKAMVATTTQTAAQRFDLARPPWVRLDGLRLASSRTAFMAGDLETSLSIFANGSPEVGPRLAWTGADVGKLPTDASIATRTCNDWTVNTVGSNYGGVGEFQTAIPLFWHSVGAGGFQCVDVGGSSTPRLYCLED